MNHFYLLIISILLCVEVTNAFGQKQIEQNNNTNRKLRLMFYNVENLFDTWDDTLKRDDEFLPYGDKYWGWKKYTTKLNNIYKVIIAVGGWELPDIVGLCEIENRRVLNDLLRKTPLSKTDYKIIHKESPDRRGIDVALLYRKSKFKPLKFKAVEIKFSFDDEKKTRDILYVKGTTKTNDTLHIFINHWPSRWGGQIESEKFRLTTADHLKREVDSIFNENKNANIIITGDFNDSPENKSINEVLNARTSLDKIISTELYNLSYLLQKKNDTGSHKYQGKWAMLDQIIVSGNLLQKENKQNNKHLFTTIENAKIFDADFLLEKDEINTGNKPFRTYSGFRYNGGFSDHLPVFIDLRRN